MAEEISDGSPDDPPLPRQVINGELLLQISSAVLCGFLIYIYKELLFICLIMFKHGIMCNEPFIVGKCSRCHNSVTTFV